MQSADDAPDCQHLGLNGRHSKQESAATAERAVRMSRLLKSEASGGP